MPGSRKPLSRADIVTAYGGTLAEETTWRGTFDPNREGGYAVADGVTWYGHSFRALRDVPMGVAPVATGGAPQDSLYWGVTAQSTGSITQTLIRQALL